MPGTIHPCSRLTATLTTLTLTVCVAVATLVPALAHAQTYTVLHNFLGKRDGSIPYGRLLRDGAGNLYGTTEYGGRHQQGNVFRLSPQGRGTTVYDFTGRSDGASPGGNLVADSTGNIYGVAMYGQHESCTAKGCGSVYALNVTSGEITVLHTFARISGGLNPVSIVRDSTGNLYGVTTAGGLLGQCSQQAGCGTVFKIDSDGAFSIVHSFSATEGRTPLGKLLLDDSGNLYGVLLGGTLHLLYGGVFRISPEGSLMIIYSFDGPTGALPYAGLVRDRSGMLYGTTSSGGVYQMGTVFRLDPDTLVETVLYNFSGGTDGSSPMASLTLDAVGNIYGTTISGGDAICRCGTVFKLNSTGDFSVLHSFTGPEGQQPSDTVVLDGDGNLYGTTTFGGTYKAGVIFKITP
jgi:uncharacterized repeat protein (TIGR03803 family)